MRQRRDTRRKELFGATVVAGFWLLVSAIHSRVVSVIAMIVWGAFLLAIFYRDVHKNDPN